MTTNRARKSGSEPVGFAALLLSEGFARASYRTAWGLFHVIYESKGYWFRTPEAWDDEWKFPSLNVYASRSDMGHGNDANRRALKAGGRVIAFFRLWKWIRTHAGIFDSLR